MDKREPFRRTLRNRIIKILTGCDIFKGRVYNSRVQELEPSQELPCAAVYALDDDSSVEKEREHHGYQREGNIPLEIQIINETVDNEDWPDAVEFLEQDIIDLLRALQNENKIIDCIEYFTLSSSNISVDNGGDIHYASSRITYAVQYSEELGGIAPNPFERLGYSIDVDADVEDDEISNHVIELEQ